MSQLEDEKNRNLEIFCLAVKPYGSEEQNAHMATRSSPVIQPISARNLFRQVCSLVLIYITAISFLSGYKKGPEKLAINITYASTKRCGASLHQIRL